MTDSCGILVSRSPQIAHKQSVRFAGKPKIDQKEVAKTEKTTEQYSSSTNMIKMKDTNADIMENIPTKDEQLVVIVTNAHGQMIDQRAFKQLVTSSASLIGSGINDVDMKFAVEKESNHAKTSRKFPFILSDQMRTFKTIYQNR
ncbi:unnamed protein product [Onchocerca flexuosa]|nr:unnamed protein product [Onchocerca flexuosa]